MGCGLCRASRTDILWTDIISEAWLQGKMLPMENIFCIHHTKKNHKQTSLNIQKPKHKES